MSGKTQLGIFSYSYHLATVRRMAAGVSKAEQSAWLVERVNELELDGLQLHTNEWDDGTLRNFLAPGGRYLELATGTWDRESLDDCFVRAKRLGARGVRAILVHDPLAWRRFDEDQPALMRKLEEAAALAEERQMRLGVENHSDYAAWQIARLVGDLKSPYVGMCFDSGNPPSSLEDSVDAAKAAAPYVIQTHLRDFDLVHTDYGLRYEGVPLGDGIVDVKEVVRVLRNESPIDAFSIESAVRADPAKSMEENLQYEAEGARRSVDYARSELGF